MASLFLFGESKERLMHHGATSQANVIGKHGRP